MSGILLFHFHRLNRFGQFFIYEDSAAVFTRDDFLTLTDIELTLSGDFVVATAAGVAVNGYNSQAIACVLADALESSEQTLIDAELEFVGAEDKRLGLLFRLQEDVVEFCAFHCECDHFGLRGLYGLSHEWVAAEFSGAEKKSGLKFFAGYD